MYFYYIVTHFSTMNNLEDFRDMRGPTARITAFSANEEEIMAITSSLGSNLCVTDLILMIDGRSEERECWLYMFGTLVRDYVTNIQKIELVALNNNKIPSYSTNFRFLDSVCRRKMVSLYCRYES